MGINHVIREKDVCVGGGAEVVNHVYIMYLKMYMYKLA
jgi:hypothetical protein